MKLATNHPVTMTLALSQWCGIIGALSFGEGQLEVDAFRLLFSTFSDRLKEMGVSVEDIRSFLMERQKASRQ